LGAGPLSRQFVSNPLETLFRRFHDSKDEARPENCFAAFVSPEGMLELDYLGMARICGAPALAGPGLEELAEFQQFTRRNALGGATGQRLEEFFEAPMTVGFRDTLRYALGSRHPELGWEQASSLIQESLARQAQESFLPPVMHCLTPDPAMGRQRLVAVRHQNDIVVSALVPFFMGQFGPVLARQISRDTARSLIHCALQSFHDRAEGGRAELLVRKGLLYRHGATTRDSWEAILGPDGGQARDAGLFTRPLAHRFMTALEREGDRAEVLQALVKTLSSYIRKGGVLQSRAEKLRFLGVPHRVCVLLDQTAIPRRPAYNEGILSPLANLWLPESQALLNASPELLEKLLAFFVLAFRYSLETGRHLELAPPRTFKDMVLLGHWGYLAESLRVSTGRSPEGQSVSAVHFLSTPDLVSPRAEDARALGGRTRVGFGASMVDSGLQRSIGMVSSRLAAAASLGKNRPSVVDPARGVDMVHLVAREAIRGGLETLRDVSGDVVDGFFRVLGASRSGRRRGRKTEEK
jgi:hypothetical protein